VIKFRLRERLLNFSSAVVSFSVVLSEFSWQSEERWPGQVGDQSANWLVGVPEKEQLAGGGPW
jgi:hypothetical protein